MFPLLHGPSRRHGRGGGDPSTGRRGRDQGPKPATLLPDRATSSLAVLVNWLMSVVPVLKLERPGIWSWSPVPEEVVSVPLIRKTLGVAPVPAALSELLAMPLATENTLPGPMLKLPWMNPESEGAIVVIPP